MLYASNRRHGKAMEQARNLALAAQKLNASIVTIEVKSEETYQFREQNEALAKEVTELKAEMMKWYNANQPLCDVIKERDHWRSLAEKLAAALDPKKLANRFIAWPVPDAVSPDLCTNSGDYKKQFPGTITGTCLMTHAEAVQMFEYVLQEALAEFEAGKNG